MISVDSMRSTLSLISCRLLLLTTMMIIMMDPSPTMFVASYSPTSLLQTNYCRTCHSKTIISIDRCRCRCRLHRSKSEIRMQLAGGMGMMGGGMNSDSFGSQSSSFGSSHANSNNGAMMGTMGYGNDRNMNTGQGYDGYDNSMGQRQQQQQQGYGNNYMQGMNYDQNQRITSQQSIGMRYNQPAGSSVSEADFVKGNGLYDFGSSSNNNNNNPYYNYATTAATLRDVGTNQFPASNLGSIASQTAQRSTRMIERYAYDDHNMYPSVPYEYDPYDTSSQWQQQQQNGGVGGSIDYSRGFSSDIPKYFNGDYYSSESGYGYNFRSSNLSGLSHELMSREMERRRGDRRVYYDSLGSRRQRQHRGTRRRRRRLPMRDYRGRVVRDRRDDRRRRDGGRYYDDDREYYENDEPRQRDYYEQDDFESMSRRPSSYNGSRRRGDFVDRELYYDEPRRGYEDDGMYYPPRGRDRHEGNRRYAPRSRSSSYDGPRRRDDYDSEFYYGETGRGDYYEDDGYGSMSRGHRRDQFDQDYYQDDVY